jgi:hypothetical protein
MITTMKLLLKCAKGLISNALRMFPDTSGTRWQRRSTAKTKRKRTTTEKKILMSKSKIKKMLTTIMVKKALKPKSNRTKKMITVRKK